MDEEAKEEEMKEDEMTMYIMIGAASALTLIVFCGSIVACKKAKILCFKDETNVINVQMRDKSKKPAKDFSESEEYSESAGNENPNTVDIL